MRIYMHTMNRRLATYGVVWLATAAVILLGLTFLLRTEAHAPPVPAAPVLAVGACLCVAGMVIATRYRHQLVGPAFGGPGILLIGLGLAQH